MYLTGTYKLYVHVHVYLYVISYVCLKKSTHTVTIYYITNFHQDYIILVDVDNPCVKACTSLELTTYRMQVASWEARALDSKLASCMCMCTIGTRLTQSRPCSYLFVITNIYSRYSWVQLAPYSVTV